ncbi:MAG: glycosyltransferase [Rhodobacterales bacterium]
MILLNSDAMVPQGWASRLVAPLRSPDVASVTPLSNDAEIYSAPVICKNTQLDAGEGDRIDAILRNSIAGGDAPQVLAPTGVGFCMAIGAGWIGRVGPFDTQFGRGYGEEVDWCRRAAALGGVHVAATDLFVEHRGGASFGDEKLALIQKNNAVITTRYPGYDRSVQDFIRADPLATPRLVAALAYVDGLAGVDDIPVYIAHSLGGGADNYLQAQIAQSPVSLVLRFGGAERVQIELETGLGRMVASSEGLDVVVRLISTLSKRRIIYSCAVGDPDLRDIPGFLLALADGAPLEILFHDYLPVSPSYTLLDHDGVFRGVPRPDTKDAAHHYRCPDGARLDLAGWQALWGAALQAADRLVVFSRASARIVAQSYPRAADLVVIRPHQMMPPQPVPQQLVPQPDKARIVIAVLGAIGPQKGAAIVSALSLLVQGRADVGLVLIGYIAPGFKLAADTVVHGRYDQQDIPSLAQHYGVTHWLIPSIWPETFSYAVHECLATGLPTLAFDLGAQGDAVKEAANGQVLPGAAAVPDAKSHAALIVDRVMAGRNPQ